MRSVVDPARPTLRLIHREGDPAGVVASSVFTTGGSRGALLLGHLVRHRLLEHEKWTPKLQVHGIGFVVAAELRTSQEGPALLEAIHQALVEPVQPGEIARADLAAQLQAAARPFARPSLSASCTGEFGAEGAPGLDPERPPTAREVEELRRSSVHTGRVGLAALGEPALLERVAGAHRGKWPKGEPPPESWPEEDQLAVRKSAGVFELRVAARVADQSRALAAGGALRAPEHPVWTRLRAIEGLLASGPVTVALRPSGACLSLTVVRQGSGAPTSEVAAAAVLVIEQELLRSLRDARSEAFASHALTSPENAVDAAGLAAWTTVVAPTRATSTRIATEFVVPEALAPEKDAFADLLRRTEAAFEQRKIPTVSRRETGQPESWLLLGTPCGTAPEEASEAGLRALALESAARAFDGETDVRLEPWVEVKAMGLLAHAAPRPGESPAQLGERLALAAAHALSLGEIDGATIASARADQLARLGSDPGRDLMLRALSGDRPSLLEPRGLEREVAALSTLDVERARHALTREPLRAAYLASLDEAEVSAGRSELSRVLAPHRTDVLPCSKATITPAPPGSWSVSSVDPEVQPGAFVGVAVSTSAPTGRALEFLLDRDGGYLNRTLVAPGLAEAAHAHFWPGMAGSAFVIELRGPEADLARAIAQARGLLASVAAGIPKADGHLARSEDASRRGAVRRNPRGRVVELWLGRLPAPPVEADLRALAQQLREPEHRVVRVEVRTE